MSLNLAQVLRHTALRHPDRFAVRAGDTRLTYAALHDEVQRTAGGLREVGISPGDRVALLLPNMPQFTVAYFASLYAGASVVPLNAMLIGTEIAYHLRDSDAAALVVWDRFLPQAIEALSSAPAPACRLIVVRGKGAEAPLPDGAYDFTSLADLGQPQRDLPSTMPDDTALLLYTSGTTGKPKAAELTHFNVFFNSHIFSRFILPLDESCVALCCLPMFHAMGQAAVHNAVLHTGGELVIMQRFEPKTALELMEQHRVTYFCGVPTMYFALLQHPDAGRFDLRSLRYCVCGGAPMPLEVIRAFEERHGVAILEGYGLSEASPIVAFNRLDRKRKIGTVGLPLDGVEVRLERADGSLVNRPGEPGEICMKGHNVMKGYYKRPEETRQTIRDGWLHTGDVGTIDEEGYYSVVDRLKDMIIRGGLNVYPREIEEILYAHPAVAEAAVIGVPDPSQGEEVKAVIALKPGAAVTEDEIISYCRQRMAAYKYPRLVEIKEALPKGPTGKILKRLLAHP